MKKRFRYCHNLWLKLFLWGFVLLNVFGLVFTFMQLMQLNNLYVKLSYGIAKLILFTFSIFIATCIMTMRYNVDKTLKLSFFTIDLNNGKFDLQNLVSIIIKETNQTKSLYCCFLFSPNHERIILANISTQEFDLFITAIKKENPKVITNIEKD